MSVCLACGHPLSGRQTMYCSKRCKARYGTYRSQKNRQLRRKIMLVNAMGGGCQTCGYDVNLAALSFHHTNPEDKERLLSMPSLSHMTYDRVMVEAEKCILLCMNCHMAEHSPELAMSQLQNHRIYSSVDDYGRDGFCWVCSKELTGHQRKFCSKRCKNRALQSYEAQQARGIHRKLAFVERLGGACTRCGYNENLAALSFHHIDAGKKRFKLDARNLANRTQSALEAEIKKCTLLCANCHMEIHNSSLMLTSVEFD